ncbi:STAS domain-containing protein [Halobacillus aidingensis]|uniref:RsbT co-antagonist protein RsbR n=1 Tax=Halobacillus aidingensis TaxID=240303 RepID=A0A1H0HCH6_HALAD|nr:STAS domain-containing protein [Halobacillus aidingensis]SDO16842.1 rsbT co-antagonist protein RsbR [Halobacillus aidingensis]
MSEEQLMDSEGYYSLKSAAQKIFEVVTQRLDVQTAYVTMRGKHAMTVLSSLNKNEEIVPEGFTIDYEESHCRLIINDQDHVLSTSNLMDDKLTREMKASAQLQVKGYLGVTLKDLKGNVFGTLCVMDKEEKQFNEEDIEFLQTIAAVLSHMIDLDQTQYNMGLMNVPIIPITEGVSVVPIQGIVDEERADKLMSDVLRYGKEQDIDHFVLDLSGLVVRDQFFSEMLPKLIHALQVMGIDTILTGITPEVAHKEIETNVLSTHKPKTVSNLKTALSTIGFKLVESH